MSLIFRRWTECLKQGNVTEFLNLYSNQIFIIPTISNEMTPKKTLFVEKEEKGYGKLKVFRNFENLLLSDDNTFNINHLKLTSNFNKTLIFCMDFNFRGYELKSLHNMMLDQKEESIIYHHYTVDIL